MQRPIARITGLGAAAPATVVTNADLEKRLDTSDKWIVERTGIRERRMLQPGEALSDLFAAASGQAMAEAGVGPRDLDAIICGTVTPDRRLPATACEVQARLGANRALAFDLAAACPGWLYGLTVAEGLIASGASGTVLVLGGDRNTSIIDPTDRTTAVLFGDGAGAAVLRPADDGRGILSSVLGADGSLGHLLYIPAGGSTEPLSEKVVRERSYYVRMAGREVFKVAVRRMAQACCQALVQAGTTGDQLDLLVPHQANRRIIEATAKEAGVPMCKVMVNVDRYGNTSAGSILLALAQAREEGRLFPGALVALVSFGAGFTWGAMVMRW